MPTAAVSKAPRLRDLSYLGGHPSAPAELDHVDVTFDSEGAHFARRSTTLGTIAWPDVVDLAADADTTTSRMTLPRVWLLGIVAALFPKRDRRVLVRIQDRTGAWLFTVEGIDLDELRAGFRTLRGRFVPGPPTSSQSE